MPGYICLVWGLLFCDTSRFVARWLVRVGHASYAIYIGHFLVLFIIARVSSRMGVPRTDWAYGLTIVVVSALSCGLALGLSRLIEKPGQALGKRVVARLQARERVRLATAEMP